MAQAIVCPQCDLSFKVADASEVLTVKCPQCGRRILLGDPEELEEILAEEEEEEREKERKRKKRRKKNRERMASLDRVNQGLLFHFIAMGLFTLAILFFWIGFGIVLAIIVSGEFTVQVIGIANAMLWIAMVFTALATLLEIPNCVMSLFLPDQQGRAFLLVSLLFRAGCLVLGVTFALVEEKGLVAAMLAVLLLLSWTFWLLYLWKLAHHIGQEAIAWDMILCLIHTFVNIVVALLFLFMVSIYVRFMVLVPAPVLRLFITVTFVGPITGILVACFKLSYQDSFLKVLLYPTGVTFMFRYLETLGSLRMFLHRRA